MIDAKQAVQIAKLKAAEMLDRPPYNLEESPLFSLDPLDYKRFLIDVENGELLAMKVREVATR
jgi:hypothetical protein